MCELDRLSCPWHALIPSFNEVTMQRNCDCVVPNFGRTLMNPDTVTPVLFKVSLACRILVNVIIYYICR